MISFGKHMKNKQVEEYDDRPSDRRRPVSSRKRYEYDYDDVPPRGRVTRETEVPKRRRPVDYEDDYVYEKRRPVDYEDDYVYEKRRPVERGRRYEEVDEIPKRKKPRSRYVDNYEEERVPIKRKIPLSDSALEELYAKMVGMDKKMDSVFLSLVNYQKHRKTDVSSIVSDIDMKCELRLDYDEENKQKPSFTLRYILKDRDSGKTARKVVNGVEISTNLKRKVERKVGDSDGVADVPKKSAVGIAVDLKILDDLFVELVEYMEQFDIEEYEEFTYNYSNIFYSGKAYHLSPSTQVMNLRKNDI